MEVRITKEKVEQLLKEKGLSKAEFATKMGVKRQNLDVMLNSKKRTLTPSSKWQKFSMSLLMNSAVSFRRNVINPKAS